MIPNKTLATLLICFPFCAVGHIKKQRVYRIAMMRQDHSSIYFVIFLDSVEHPERGGCPDLHFPPWNRTHICFSMLSEASLVTVDQELAGNPSKATPDLHCLTLQDKIGKMEVNDCLHCKHVCLRFLFVLLFRVREIGSLPSVFQAGFNEQKKAKKESKPKHTCTISKCFQDENGSSDNLQRNA